MHHVQQRAARRPPSHSPMDKPRPAVLTRGSFAEAVRHRAPTSSTRERHTIVRPARRVRPQHGPSKNGTGGFGVGHQPSCAPFLQGGGGSGTGTPGPTLVPHISPQHSAPRRRPSGGRPLVVGASALASPGGEPRSGAGLIRKQPKEVRPARSTTTSGSPRAARAGDPSRRTATSRGAQRKLAGRRRRVMQLVEQRPTAGRRVP